MVFKKQLRQVDAGAPKLKQELSRAIQRSVEAERELAALRHRSARLGARFDLIREASNDGLWDMEANSANPTAADNPFWWSRQFRSLLGFADETEFPNLLGSWSSRLHPEDAEATLAAFAAHLRDGAGRTPYDVTYRLRCRDGEYRRFSARGQTIRAADGTALRVAGSLSDITDRNTVLGLERHAADIVANLPAGLMVMDDALHILGDNSSFLQILGLTSDAEVSGRRLDALARARLRGRAGILLRPSRSGAQLRPVMAGCLLALAPHRPAWLDCVSTPEQSAHRFAA